MHVNYDFWPTVFAILRFIQAAAVSTGGRSNNRITADDRRNTGCGVMGRVRVVENDNFTNFKYWKNLFNRFIKAVSTDWAQ